MTYHSGKPLQRIAENMQGMSRCVEWRSFDLKSSLLAAPRKFKHILIEKFDTNSLDAL